MSFVSAVSTRVYVSLDRVNIKKLGTGVAIGVVLDSDGGLEKDWSGLKQPGVLLAYTSTLANALMGLSFAQAAVVFYWLEAMKPVPVEFCHVSAVIVISVDIVSRLAAFIITGLGTQVPWVRSSPSSMAGLFELV